MIPILALYIAGFGTDMRDREWRIGLLTLEHRSGCMACFPTEEGAMAQETIGYVLAWVGTGAWVICFWWMYRISARQDALLTELKELAKTQHDILREVHPDVGEIKGHVVEEQGKKLNEIAEQVTQVTDAVASP
jgi:hypothetical protein